MPFSITGAMILSQLMLVRLPIFFLSLDEVLSKDQFSTVRNGKYKKVNITEDTILSCEFVFSNGDTTSGALYFEAGNSNIHSKYAEYLFSDKSGHSFYK